jgi:hypothetical protein
MHVVKPQGFGFLVPTFAYFSAWKQAYSAKLAASLPKEYIVVVPARAAYSHSASVGSR